MTQPVRFQSFDLAEPSVAPLPLSKPPPSSLARSRASHPIPSPIGLPKPDQRFSRPFSLDSPTLYEHPPSANFPSSPTVRSEHIRAFAQEPAHAPLQISTDVAATSVDFSDVLSEYDDLISDAASNSNPDRTPTTVIEEDEDEDDYHGVLRSSYTQARDNSNPNSPTLMYAQKHTPAHLNLHPLDASNTYGRPFVDSPSSPKLDKAHRPALKSPGIASSPLANFFGWGNSSPSVTEFSSLASPLSPNRPAGANDLQRVTSSNTETPGKTNAEDALDYCESYLSTPPPLSVATDQVGEMEEELKAITSELAASIRRELDLEDLVDRLQDQVNNSQGSNKRTSDYFSDSGYSSAKQSEYEQSRDEVEKVQRRADQEKASIRVELTTKLQDERSMRKALDQQIKQLAERASQIDLIQMNSVDVGDRVKDLESTCEDLRRRLSEERESKSNIEDLLSGLKTELQDACNERDNLKDEVIPVLRSRIEGLETEAAEYANLTYESSKMQQELQALKLENSTLRSNVDLGTVAEPPSARSSRAMSIGLSRSNSVATGSARAQRPPALALKRSSSVKGAQVEPREVLADRLKDVESQRDALHKALKNLLDRQDYQARENSKRIQVLESERQRLMSGSPKKAGFERDIANLRAEINVLRHRAEDAVEQKWQVEKGLVGLKMDLDRAEEEITALRSLLQENDILIPPALARASNSSDASDSVVTSDSLRQAYQELQKTYAEALERIKKLELGTEGASNEATQLAMDRLERSLAVAITERDAASQQADDLRAQYEKQAARESMSLETEKALADELGDSAKQVEQLAAQVSQQLATNSDLRNRLAEAITRGDADRKTNSDRIAALQDRLRVLEEQLVTAQTVSEERIARHEEEIANLRSAQSDKLRRINGDPLTGGLRSPGLRSPGLQSPGKSPLLSPRSPLVPRSPRLNKPKSYEEETEVVILRARILELENALSDTEMEMQEVVARMGIAQIEVLNLQEEREAAVRETRKLQKVLEQERLNAFQERFKSLQG